jgi:hypothetical protein
MRKCPAPRSCEKANNGLIKRRQRNGARGRVLKMFTLQLEALQIGSNYGRLLIFSKSGDELCRKQGLAAWERSLRVHSLLYTNVRTS